MKKYLTTEMQDGSVWGVPVEIIARNRAEHYAHEFGDDVERSLAEDTIPLFEQDSYEIQDWAVNNMNWSDFDGHQVKLKDASAPDFEEAWMDGRKGFSDDEPKADGLSREDFEGFIAGEERLVGREADFSRMPEWTSIAGRYRDAKIDSAWVGWKGAIKALRQEGG